MRPGELSKLQEKMEKAEETNDTKAIDELIAKADILEQRVGTDYSKILDGLDELDPKSARRTEIYRRIRYPPGKVQIETLRGTGRLRLLCDLTVT